jgi:3-deoxy-7-phosphoheptulonate synthase
MEEINMVNRGLQLTDSSASPEALRIYHSLPAPDYSRNYQPTYQDQHALLGGIHELSTMEGVTTPRQIDALSASLAGIARGLEARPVMIMERCAEPADIMLPIRPMAKQAVASRDRVLQVRPDALVIQRNRGQNTKPRTSFLQTVSRQKLHEELQRSTEVPEQLQVVSYMGDAVNAEDISGAQSLEELMYLRQPNATRMVAAAIQARSLEEALASLTTERIPAAHEALLLPYELSYVRRDPETGKKYLLSTDLPWIGKRTNAIDSPHVAMLAEVENPIGIKLGPDSTAAHIHELQTRLNPEGKPGKLLFMIRMGLQDSQALEDVLTGIATYAPNSLQMYDIHGVTETAPTGEKIRYTGNIIKQVENLSAACGRAGLMLHGLHLESINDDSRLECVDAPDQLPTHPGGVDPQLNPRQLTYVLAQTAEYLLKRP